MIVLAQALQSCPSLQRLSVGSQVRTLPYFLPSSRQFRWRGLASWVFQVSDTGVLVLVKLIPQLGSLEHLTLGSYMEGTETLSALLEVRCVALRMDLCIVRCLLRRFTRQVEQERARQYGAESAKS